MDQDLRTLKLSVQDLGYSKANRNTLTRRVRHFKGEKQRKHNFILKNVLLSWT